MSDGHDAPFLMHGAREAIAHGLDHVEKQVEAIERAVGDNPALAFDLAKTLLESVCQTILGARNVEFAADDDLPRLFKLATQCLPFLPAASRGEARVRSSLAQTLKGLATAVQGVCELRNQCGFASHGSGAAKPAMERVQALMAASAADTIVGFLHRVHRADSVALRRRRVGYEENSDFNDYVDELHEVARIFEVEFRPSEVLFELDPQGYGSYLTEFKLEQDSSALIASGQGHRA